MKRSTILARLAETGIRQEAEKVVPANGAPVPLPYHVVRVDEVEDGDDKGRVSKTIVTEEDVKLKTGLITWSPAYLQALIETARVTETGKSGQHKHRTYKLGGLANKTGKRYLYRFVHTRDDGRKLRITVTGKNSGTISIAFQNDNPTQVDAEVTAQSLDSDGTLVIMDDELTENAT